ncbi:unnamed protein product [Arctogadus glacialis]
MFLIEAGGTFPGGGEDGQGRLKCSPTWPPKSRSAVGHFQLWTKTWRLFRSPGSLFGGPACLNKDSKAMESLLGKLHRSTAMQARLANTAAILTLYTNNLSGLMQNQPVDASLAREFQSATMCLASVSKE